MSASAGTNFRRQNLTPIIRQILTCKVDLGAEKITIYNGDRTLYINIHSNEAERAR